MTKPNYTHITLVVDRTGSMSGMSSEATTAINAFVADQKRVDGECSLLLADFDSQESFRTVYDGTLADCPAYSLEARGMTPLWDAVGRGITQTGQRLAALAEDERPSKVIFVVVTDGEENASREYNARQVRDLILDHENTWGWEFVYLASGAAAWANQTSFAGTGMHTNTTRSAGGSVAYGSTFAVASANIVRSRAGQTVDYAVEIDEDGNVITSDPA